MLAGMCFCSRDKGSTNWSSCLRLAPLVSEPYPKLLGLPSFGPCEAPEQTHREDGKWPWSKLEFQAHLHAWLLVGFAQFQESPEMST